MALVVAWILAIAVMKNGVLAANEEVALTNVTRFGNGDFFTLDGTECGLTRCMELSHGTALAALGGHAGCVCQCRADTPTFREDQQVCINHLDECPMASFGRGAVKPQIPFVFLPLKGQIIYPSKEIIFTDVEDAVCAVTSAQFLSPSGWVTLRDLVDNDVPFSLYRDEGSTFLQWRGSVSLHARLEGRLVAVHVLCSSPTPARIVASCAAFRVAGASHNALLDVRSIPFHAGERVSSEPTHSQGLTAMETLAIGVCVLMLIFIYAAGIAFYLHYKENQKRKDKDPEMYNTHTLSTDNGSSFDSRIDMENVRMKTNPLLMSMTSLGTDYLNDSFLSDVSERTEDTLDFSNTKSQMISNANMTSAMVHGKRKKQPRPTIRTVVNNHQFNERLQKRSTSPDLERVPHSDLSIIDCSMENNGPNQTTDENNGDLPLRRKLYFNPIFFETEHLKNPPPAAIDFLIKIREIMSMAKEKMTSRRFIPILSDIPEEESYHTIDLGWDIPCARRGRRFSAISLKRENSRRSAHCGGCPGCDNSERVQKTVPLLRSNSCKSCVSEDYKQKIVRKWLDEVPSPKQAKRPVKSISKVNGTPKTIEPKVIKENNTEELKPEKIVEAQIKSQDEQKKELQSSVTDKKDKKLTNSAKEIKIGKNKSPKESRVLKDISHKDIKPLQDIRSTKDLRALKDIRLLQDKNPPEDIKYTQNNQSPKDLKILKDRKELSTPSTVSVVHKKRNITEEVSRNIRKKLPPPPPPPISPSISTSSSPISTLPPPIPSKERKKIDEIATLSDVKKNMEAVIKELYKGTKAEIKEIVTKTEVAEPIPPKIIIPVIAEDNHYFSDDNLLTNARKRDVYQYNHTNNVVSTESNAIQTNKRRFSLACGQELAIKSHIQHLQNIPLSRDRITRSWRDVRKAVEDFKPEVENTHSDVKIQNNCQSVSKVFIDTSEPLYDNMPKIGPITIKVTGPSVENSRRLFDNFDPDTLDRKPRQINTRIEKILLKSNGSFKYKSSSTDEEYTEPPHNAFSRKIGSLRQIYEAKAKAQQNEMCSPFYQRRNSVSFGTTDSFNFIRPDKTPDLILQTENGKELKPPVPPKQRRGLDVSSKFMISRENNMIAERRRMLEERERFSQYSKVDLNARRSGRRSARTRSRRTDLKKLIRTEDSGYMSTDSNESKYRTRYLMQLKSKHPMETLSTHNNINKVAQQLQNIESDTDEFESFGDGRSESGGESIETDSVFFGNFVDSKQMLAELDLNIFDFPKMQNQEQLDSGFAGETHIILSCDSDSEHRSVISIETGRSGRAAAHKIIHETPFMHSLEC